jgi:predicted ATPase
LPHAGPIEHADETLATALEVAERTGERFYIAELVRLQGELRLAQDEQARCEVKSIGLSV